MRKSKFAMKIWKIHKMRILMVLRNLVCKKKRRCRNTVKIQKKQKNLLKKKRKKKEETATQPLIESKIR
jgi:hypothetical protein